MASGKGTLSKAAGVIDSRAFAGGLAGACVFAFLGGMHRRDAKALGSFGAGAAAAAYYSLAGVSRHPVRTGVLLGAAAGVGAAISSEKPGTSAAVTNFSTHLLAGFAAGAVCSALSGDWTAEDFGEAFFP